MEIGLTYLGQLRHLADKEGETQSCAPGTGLGALLHKVAAGYGG